MINNTVLVGRMTKDPELRRTGSGKAVTSFTLAVNRAFKQDGQPDADFIQCVTWNKQAENVERYCSKGSQVAVIGSIQTRSYDNNQGQKVYVTEIICSQVQFLDSKRENSNQDNQYQNNANNAHTPYQAPQGANVQQPQYQDDIYDIMNDDIEF